VLYEACGIHPAGLVGAYRLMHEVFPATACEALMQARHQQFSISDGLAAFQAFLLAVLPHSRTGLFADVLMKAQHKIFFPMVDLSEALGFGQRQLERRIMDAFGLPLRDIRRMSRYGYSMLHLLSNRPEHGELTRIAQEFGYYDQAHMAREFVSLIGHSPTQLLQKSHQMIPVTGCTVLRLADFRRLFYVV
jgi:AraC-like DNA-binding protein